VLAGVIGGGAVLSGGSTSDRETSPPTTTEEGTTTSEATTTSLEPTDTTARSLATFRIETLGPLLGDEEGTVVYGYRSDTSELVRIDLASGEVLSRGLRGPRGDLAGGEVEVIARTDGAVVNGSWGAVFVPDSSPDALRRGSRIPGATGENLLAATAADELWVVERDGRRAVFAQRVDTSGAEIGPGVQLPENTFLLGDDGTGGLLLAAPGGRYRASDSGPTERVAPTTVVAWSARVFVLLRCDEALRCDLVVVDRASGRSRSIGPAPRDAVSLDYAALSPNDRFMVRPVPEGIEVTDLRTGAATVRPTSVDSTWSPTGSPTAIAWSASGSHLLWLDGAGQLMAWAMGENGPEPSDPVVVGAGELPSLEALSIGPADR
jgi:hypothetical protein